MKLYLYRFGIACLILSSMVSSALAASPVRPLSPSAHFTVLQDLFIKRAFFDQSGVLLIEGFTSTKDPDFSSLRQEFFGDLVAQKIELKKPDKNGNFSFTIQNYEFTEAYRARIPQDYPLFLPILRVQLRQPCKIDDSQKFCSLSNEVVVEMKPSSAFVGANEIPAIPAK